MDSSGRTTQRQYNVGRGRLNTNSAEHLGVSEKWDSQVHPLEDRMERKRELLLVSCKVKEEENEKPTPNTRWKSAPGWEGVFGTDSRRAQSTCWPFSHTPQRRWQLQGTTVHGQKMQRGQKVKGSGHCASSIKEKPIDWDPECRSRKVAWQKPFPGSLSCVWWESFPRFMPSNWLPGCYTQQWLHSVINPLLPLGSRGSINCGPKYNVARIDRRIKKGKRMTIPTVKDTFQKKTSSAPLVCPNLKQKDLSSYSCTYTQRRSTSS